MLRQAVPRKPLGVFKPETKCLVLESIRSFTRTNMRNRKKLHVYRATDFLRRESRDKRSGLF
jgi:hypothetical protein